MDKPYFQSNDKSFVLYKGETVHYLRQIEGKVDMIFADPPYFLSSGDNCVFNGTPITFDKGQWDRKMSTEEIDKFNRDWLHHLRTHHRLVGMVPARLFTFHIEPQ